MNRWQGKVAVVTGASCGIGLATAQALVREGMTVVGLARRKDKMESEMKNVTGKGKFYAVECDITNEQRLDEVFQWIKKNVGVVQVLINNAGIVKYGKIQETSMEDLQKIFAVNVMALLSCTKRAIRVMQEADVEGHIVNINSVLGHKMGPFKYVQFNVYPATKYAVTAISETLQKELHGGKIRVTSVSPGLVKTEIVDFDNLPKELGELPIIQSEDIAAAVVYAIGTPARVEVSELTVSPLGEVLF